jgi:hypothetical protein
VTALGRSGITGECDGGEAGADGQTIAGREAASMQLTNSRTLDDQDAIALTAMVR